MKKSKLLKNLNIMLFVLIFTLLFMLTGCSARNYVNINRDDLRTPEIKITLDGSYEYVDYDKINTDGGCDIVIHYKKVEE